MEYKEEDIKSYCGNCSETFAVEIYHCPNCGSNLINYNTKLFTEIFAQQKWERHNKGFKKQKENGAGEVSYRPGIV